MSPSSPYETRSPSSTCAGRPEPSRPATYLTSGAYVTISRSRRALSFVRRYSSQTRWMSDSPATPREYELVPPFPHCGHSEAPHPRREHGRRGRDHPPPAERTGDGDPCKRAGEDGEERGHGRAG